MAKTKPAKAPRRRKLFDEMMGGVRAMREHREGRLTLRTHEVEPISLPPVDADFVRETREGLRMSRQVFAFKIGVNPTLERWEQGRSKPNEQAVAHLAGSEVPRHARTARVAERAGVTKRSRMCEDRQRLTKTPKSQAAAG